MSGVVSDMVPSMMSRATMELNRFSRGPFGRLGRFLALLSLRDESVCTLRTGHRPENATRLAGCVEFFGPAERMGSVCLVAYEPSFSLTTYLHGDLTSHLLTYHKV
jgi:hypothetical protein